MTSLDPSIVVAALTLLGVVLTAVGGVVGALVVRGTETRRIITGAPAGYAKLVDDLQQERAELRERLSDSERRVAVLADDLASVRTRLRGVEAGQDTDRRLIETLRAAYVDLRRFVRAAGIVPPPIPDGLGVEDTHPGLTPA